LSDAHTHDSLPIAIIGAGPAGLAAGHMEESFRAILSSHQRSARWSPTDEIEVRAIFGNVSVTGR
jgi:thioredoxin reductase